METQRIEIRNHNPTKDKSMLMELTIYALYGILSILSGVPVLATVLGFLGSAATAFAIRALAAGAGSASGAKLSTTLSTSEFWVKVGIGFSCSLALSTTVHDLLLPKWDINSVYFIIGCTGVLLLKILTRFFKAIERRADDVANAASDAVVGKIGGKGKTKKDADR